MRCNCDDCDQVHCRDCGGHTVGNVLIGGLCQGCADIEEDAYNDAMQEEYERKLADCGFMVENEIERDINDEWWNEPDWDTRDCE